MFRTTPEGKRFPQSTQQPVAIELCHQQVLYLRNAIQAILFSVQGKKHESLKSHFILEVAYDIFLEQSASVCVYVKTFHTSLILQGSDLPSERPTFFLLYFDKTLKKLELFDLRNDQNWFV